MTPFPMEWIERAIRINSVTNRSNEDFVRFLVPLLGDAGLKVHEQKVVEGAETFTNLIAFNRTPKAELLFNTHLDTVTAGDPARWTKTGNDPHRVTRVGDRLYGLGTADVKLDFLCKLWAVKQAGAEAAPVVLVGTYGEERGLIGVQELMRSGRVAPKYAVVGEPSVLELIYAHKGHLIGQIEMPLENSPIDSEKFWKGMAAHSSTPNLGENAIEKALAEIRKRRQGIISLEGGTDSNKVPDGCMAATSESAGPATRAILGFVDKLRAIEKALGKKTDRRFSPSKCTLSFNMARTDAAGKLRLTFDIRTLPHVDSRKLQAQVEKAAPKDAQWLSLTVDPPLRGDTESALMKAASDALKRCGVKPVKRTKASSTEAAVYNQYGAQAIVFGPGVSIGNVHRPNEFNSVRQIRQAVRFYEELLRRPPSA